MPTTLEQLDLNDPDAVIDAFRAGTRANLHNVHRRGSIEVIEPPGVLIATGDLHDNPVNYAALLRVAGLDGEPSPHQTDDAPVHITFHEIIHSDRLVNGVDTSIRQLAKVAALKASHAETVHTLLANHELAQLDKTTIVKNGVKMVEAFERGIEFIFGDDAPRVEEAADEFIASMPLALRCKTPKGDFLCAHSLPGVGMMNRFDPTILDRGMTAEDRVPRQGAAHIMVWGRGYDHDQIEDLVERWGVNMFLLGHEHAEQGVQIVPPCAVVLNSDHERGVYLPIDLSAPPHPHEAVERVKRLAMVRAGQ